MNKIKIENVLNIIYEKKFFELSRLNDLQNSYINVMGEEDPKILNKISDTKELYDNKIQKLKSNYNNFEKLMSMNDSELRINNSNERINLMQDGLYSNADSNLQSIIQNRTITESEYWSEIFPEQVPFYSEEKNIDILEFDTSILDLEEINLPLPVINECDFQEVTVREELEESTDLEFIEKINYSIQYVKSKIGAMYNLEILIPSELFGLRKTLEKYIESEPCERLEQMIDFINRGFSEEQWSCLTDSEINTVKYTRQKDRWSDPGNLQNITKGREEKLARIILKCYGRMIDTNSRYRNVSLPTGDDSVKKCSIIFCVEKYILHGVISPREPLYTKNAVDNLKMFIDFHNKIIPQLSSIEIADLGVNYQVCKMNNLYQFYKKHKKLTPKQRTFAFNLMTGYLLILQNADLDLKQKIMEGLKQPVTIGMHKNGQR